ncbi:MULTISPECIES: amidohydrolase family protein [unclassified Beijerinckia]|uniref:metal-dependent hydrolase family protein n=1 Tax=unclassified Beijerinckia TaxID=2638183 RepID=UPI00089B1139|nr:MULTISPECIES: amidohydrolase family protein [unclassified Beijerinckia]MDH7799232.1 imidazolonepropionase-like amidohydrolase [Beijerinckia sp. GAS462]SED91242.1 Imidazolonepropionase [Beijerinckia sp. 28-YEA-48]
MTRSSANSVTVYSNGRILDGLRDIPNGYLVTKDESIVAVGVGEPKQRLPEGNVRQVDLAGRALLPGFIDCHVHLTMHGHAAPTPIVTKMDEMVTLMRASINALTTLHAGVTTVRDCGAPKQIDFALRRAAQEGLCITPRLLLSGTALCMTGGHGWQLLGEEVDGRDAIRRAARTQLRAGADNIKLIASGGILTAGTDIGRPQFSIDEMRVAVDEAHDAGKIAAAHAHGAEGVKRATLAGADSIEHAYFIDQEGIELMLARGTWLVATSAAVRNVVSHGVAAGIPSHIAEKANSAIEAHMSSFKAAHRAGVRMTMGTDSGVPFTYHGSNLDELAYLVEMGLAPQEAVRVATLDSARLLKLDQQIGSLEEGKNADLIILDGDPLTDIRVLRQPEKIRQVVLNGRTVLDRDVSAMLVGAGISGPIP